MTRNIEWDEIDEALGLRSVAESKPDVAAHFREAGFTEEQARRGAELMESGSYFGFVDVATSLAGGYRFDGASMPVAPAQQERIAAVGRRLAEAARSADAAPGGQVMSPGGRTFVTTIEEAAAKGGKS